MIFLINSDEYIYFNCELIFVIFAAISHNCKSMYLCMIIPALKLIVKKANGLLLADVDINAVINLYDPPNNNKTNQKLFDQSRQSLIGSQTSNNHRQNSNNYSKCQIIWRTIKKIPFLFLALSMANIFNIALSLSIAFFGKYLIQNLKDNHTTLNILVLFIVILALKLGKSVLQMLQSYLQTMFGLGFYFHFLNQSMGRYDHSYYKYQKYGRVINFLEDDSEKLIFLPYVFIQMVFLILQIIACGVLLVVFLSQSKLIIAGILIVLFLLCTITCYSSYKINSTLMHSKDSRVAANFNIDSSNIWRLRNRELFKIKILFLFELIAKIISQISYVLFFLFLVWQLYHTELSDTPIILTLLNILRGNIQKVFYYGPLFFSSYNSFTRMVETLNTMDQFENSQPTAQKQQQAIVDIQKGQIEFLKIYKLLQKYISKYLLLLLLGLILFTCLFGAYNMDNYKEIIMKKDIAYSRIIVYILVPIVLCILIFVVIALITLSVSNFVSKKMQQVTQRKNSEDVIIRNDKFFDQINKLSGDLRALDKSLCLNLNDFLMDICYFMSSIVYTGYLLLSNWSIQIIYISFLAFLIGYSIKLNRYIMRARRDFLRSQCNYKRSLIKQFFSKKNSENYGFQKILIKILQHKYLGFISQSLAIMIIMLIFSLLSSGILTTCMFLKTDSSALLVLYSFFMQSDLDIYFIYVSAIRTELSLVSVQRIINNMFPKER